MTARHYAIYDSETSGANVRFDQILQMAAILTDADFQTQDQFDLRSRRLPHVVPSPKALEVTGVDPYALADPKAMGPFDFACEVHRIFSRWSPAVFLGYNTINFDEEITRQMFWQNLLQPYVTNTQGSIRADLLVMMRAYSAIRPNAFTLPKNDQNKDSFRLEHVAPANGFADMDAHDAFGDVLATAYMARLCRDADPALWEHLISLATPSGCDKILAAPTAKLVTHFGLSETHLIARLGANPKNPKQVCAFDLSVDPTPYLDLSARQIEQQLFGGDDRAFRVIKTNAQPVLFHEGDALAPEVTAQVSAAEANQRMIAINDHPTFKPRVIEALQLSGQKFEKGPEGRQPEVEEQIYDGFPPREDKKRMEAFHAARTWAERRDIVQTMEDRRLRQIGWRIVLNEAPETLSAGFVDAARKGMVARRLTNPGADAPWTTIPKARAGLEEVADPSLRDRIGRWLDELETAERSDAA